MFFRATYIALKYMFCYYIARRRRNFLKIEEKITIFYSILGRRPKKNLVVRGTILDFLEFFLAENPSFSRGDRAEGRPYNNSICTPPIVHN